VALSTICSVGILVRSLHPEKRLNVDHVTRTHIIKVPAHHVREIEKARIGLPSRAGFVAEIETVAFGCFPGDCWLQVALTDKEISLSLSVFALVILLANQKTRLGRMLTP
jgi:hypothetical protein